MSRIVDEVLTQDNDDGNDKGDSRRYVIIVVDQLGQLRHDKVNVVNIIMGGKENRPNAIIIRLRRILLDRV
jgi:hypothetical protein